MFTRDKTMRSSTTIIVLSCMLSLTACGEPDEPTQTFEIEKTRPASDNVDADRDGWLDSTEMTIGADPEKQSPICNTSTFERQSNTVSKVDVIIIVDNSGSMLGEMPAVFKGVFNELIPAMDNVELDYNIILFTEAQTLRSQCPTCIESLPKVNLIDVRVNSTDGLSMFTSHEEKVSPHLRQDSLKVFVNITDDNSTLSGFDFDKQLRDAYPGQFYDANSGKRNYIFHSVIGVEVPNELNVGMPADQPVVNDRCSTAPNAGQVYQQLSRSTNGLRFSVCSKEIRYDDIFTQIVSQTNNIGRIPCTILLPQPSNPKRKADPTRIGMQAQLANEQLPKALYEIAPTERCDAEAFYTVNIEKKTYIKLCPALCDDLNAASGSTLQIATGCIGGSCIITPTRRSCN